MSIISVTYRSERELIIAMSGFFWGFHMNQVGTKKWDKGGVEDFKGNFLENGDLLVTNHYENGETYFYFAYKKGGIGWLSEQNLDEDPEFQAFVKNHKNNM